MLLHKNKMMTALSVCLLFSCASHFFPEFMVEDSFVEGGSIVAVFSAPVRPESIRENFYLTEDGKTVSGTFSFETKKARFAPETPISENHVYRISIYSGAEDVNGNSLERDYQKTILTKSDFSAPIVSSVEEIRNSDDEIKSLSIGFSKNIDEESFSQSFSIAPSLRFAADWRDGKTVRIVFLDTLAEKTHYSARISTSLKDERNNFLEKDFTHTFENTGEYTSPEYEVRAYDKDSEAWKKMAADKINESIDFSKGIEIRFNKKLDADSFQSIHVEPAMPFSLKIEKQQSGNFSDSVRVNFNSAVKWNTECRLFVPDRIGDGYGAKVAARSFCLKNNSEKSRPPELCFVIVESEGGHEYVSRRTNYANLLFPSTVYQPGFEKDLPIHFVFAISRDSSRIDKISAMKSISVSAENSAASIDIKHMSICSYDEINSPSLRSAIAKEIDSLSLSDRKLCIATCFSKFTNSEVQSKISEGVINFQVKEGLCDDKQNRMEEGAILKANKQ